MGKGRGHGQDRTGQYREGRHKDDEDMAMATRGLARGPCALRALIPFSSYWEGLLAWEVLSASQNKETHDWL
eukprot:CAMPEP_0206631186 /NCGR_PEP_ID=MMETSP0325_2-20121206/68037_1 /ASSEMBLY_ACC=CAM_ASM_000347 /TAXON_ID=2866 /ORGANISM="Crypthecodinium cohnii, Strain Seligo" /LENGTH=71 /DNA_ID=CAMNT_0054156225 /DNA_START=26 /DNA_END=238 /DNA_ORIENTATION=+